MPTDRNVFGAELEPCSTDPTTGTVGCKSVLRVSPDELGDSRKQLQPTVYLRDGCCRRVDGDRGRHEVYAVVTEEFLEFGRARGNDLTTPRPDFEFPGLEPGDRWCLCLGGVERSRSERDARKTRRVFRRLEAEEAGVAPPIVLEATHEAVLRDVDPDTLRDRECEKTEDDPTERAT